MEVDQLGEAVQHHLVPLAPAVLAAAHELDGRVGALHHYRERARLLDVVARLQAADLPAPVHLVAEPPVPHPMRLSIAVRPPQVGPRGIPGAVAVLDPRLGLVHAARAHVHADDRLGFQLAAVLDELVGPEAVRLLRVPRELAAPRPGVLRPHPVEPVVAAHEVAARPAQHREAERTGGLQHVAAEAARVRERGALVVDAAVDAAAEMLDELAEDARVHRAEPSPQVDADARGHGVRV